MSDESPQALSPSFPAPCSAFRVVKADATLYLTRPCPYCGGKVSVRATGWTQEYDGLWVADMIDMECDTEPDIDGPEWPEWSAIHGDYDFCDAWHRLHDAAIDCLKRRVRFDLDTPNTQLCGGALPSASAPSSTQ